MKNSGGFITVDYLFAFFLVSGFSLAIMTFSATLSTVEIVQYMAFASARNYFAGNVSELKQKEAAATKFFELKDNPVIAPLLNGGWFEVPDNSYIVDYNLPAKYNDYKNFGENPSINLFHGVAVAFKAKILDFQVPFFGSTKKSDGDSSKTQGFTTNITAFLGREPSFEECNLFNEDRWEKIKELANSVGASNYSAAAGDNDYIVINDNGC